MDRQTVENVRARILVPGFTPAARDVAALIVIASEETQAGNAQGAISACSAIASVQGPVVRRVQSALSELPAVLVASLVDTLRRRTDHSDELAFVSLCASLLEASETPTRRAATRALGEVKSNVSDASVSALRAALGRATLPDERAPLLRALVRLGATIDPEDRAFVEKDPRASKHRVIAARDKARGAVREASPFELPADMRVVWVAREGLESILAQELRARLGGRLGDVRVAPGRVTAFVRGSSEALDEARCALGWGLDLGNAGSTDPLAAARVLDEPRIRTLSASMGLDRPRFRMESTDSRGRGRPVANDVAWRIAEAFRADRNAGPINDPTAAEVVLRVATDASILLIPRREDRRFAYRTADVPAASHPTIAAALARATEPEAEDIVWDPFVGSGLELCERALLHPYAELIGTDTDPAAVQKAHRNLAAVASTASLSVLDARSFTRHGITSVITNPPLGRRVASDQTVPALLADVCTRITNCVASRARVALVSPRPDLTRETLSRGGLAQQAEYRIDMGGFDAYLQVFAK